jgi:hypothetical protein
MQSMVSAEVSMASQNNRKQNDNKVYDSEEGQGGNS